MILYVNINKNHPNIQYYNNTNISVIFLDKTIFLNMYILVDSIGIILYDLKLLGILYKIFNLSILCPLNLTWVNYFH